MSRGGGVLPESGDSKGASWCYTAAMGRVAALAGLSAQEFLSWEREQPNRHEYFHGQVFASASGSLRHNALCSRINAALHDGLKHSCTVLSSDQRVGLAGGERYVYPDLSVVCGSAVLEEGTRDVLANPTLFGRGAVGFDGAI